MSHWTVGAGTRVSRCDFIREWRLTRRRAVNARYTSSLRVSKQVWIPASARMTSWNCDDASKHCDVRMCRSNRNGTSSRFELNWSTS